MGDQAQPQQPDKRRVRIRKVLQLKADNTKEFFTRVKEDLDPFQGAYSSLGLIEPDFPMASLVNLYHKSDVLQTCTSAYVDNVEGFGYKFEFLGDDYEARSNPGAKAELTKLESFCEQVNDQMDLVGLREALRKDDCIYGNMAMEVIPKIDGEIQMLCHVPFKNMRVSRLGDQIPIDLELKREGKIIQVKSRRAFRKFAQVTSYGKDITWFKEYGDPRPMNSATGVYEATGTPATSIIWMRKPTAGFTYGLPCWLGATLEAMGRYSAQYVNYDIFRNQGIPPMAVLVSNGTLTDDSIDELEQTLMGWKGAENFNRVVILETMPAETLGIDSAAGRAEIELKNLTDYRNEDMMFGAYLAASKKAIRSAFRLPPIYTGDSDDYTRATAAAAQEVTEQQVFIPERARFDRVFNRLVIRQGLKCYQWEIRSKGPRITGTEDITRAVSAFAKIGALSINRSIEMLNSSFGLEVSRIDAPWADMPIMIIDKLLTSGQLPDGVSELIDKTNAELKKQSGGAVGDVLGGTNALGGRERDQTLSNTERTLPPAQPVKKADVIPLIRSTPAFTDDEKELYLRLSALDQTIAQHTSEVVDDEDLEL